MSRIGNRVLPIPQNISIDIGESSILVSNSTDKIQISYNRFLVKPYVSGESFRTERVNSSKESRAQYGTINALVANALVGLTRGFTIGLEIVGVGYKASMEGQRLRLDLGFSHPILVDIPPDIRVKLISSLEIELSSHNRESIGEFAARIRKFKPPEPYKGKGIKYKDEVIIRKVGKTSEGTKK